MTLHGRTSDMVVRTGLWHVAKEAYSVVRPLGVDHFNLITDVSH